MQPASAYPQQPIRFPAFFTVSIVLIVAGFLAMMFGPNSDVAHLVEGFFQVLGDFGAFAAIIGVSEPSTLAKSPDAASSRKSS